MILTCPQCASRFVLSADKLGPEGRHVKCSSCGEVWHQLPEPDELSEEESLPVEDAQEPEQEEEQPEEQGEELAQPEPITDDNFDDIPDSVKPQPDDDIADDEDEEDRDLKDKVLLIVQNAAPSAIASIVIIFAALLLLHKPIVSAMPGMMGFYSAFGISSPMPGEGLVFDQLQADVKIVDGQEQLHVSGKVINLTSQAQDVPLIEVVVKDKGGQDVGYVVIAPETQQVEKEGQVAFSGVYDGSEKGESVSVGFTLTKSKEMPKTGGGDDDSSHAPHADDHAH